MSQPETPRPVRLSPQFTEKDWRAAFEDGDHWDAAIDIVVDRIKGRWLDAVDFC